MSKQTATLEPGKDALPLSNSVTVLNAIMRDEVVKTPFEHPLPGCMAMPLPLLTDEQCTLYDELLQAVSSWVDAPDAFKRQHSKGGALSEREQMWLTKDCLLRYLRATKWKVRDAEKRLMDTLIWRREYGVDAITADSVSIENETGKQILFGFDIHGRPCHYMAPARQNTKKSERQIQHLVWTLERAIDLMPPGQEALCLLINFKESSTGSNPSIGQGRYVLNILQNHYPERLGRALIVNVPWFVWGFFKVINPFIDPMTREKLHFNEDLCLHVPATQLAKTFGGDVNFKYDHNVYWPALAKLAQRKQEEMYQRWVKGGKKIGEYETYLRGGNVENVSGMSRKADNVKHEKEKEIVDPERKVSELVVQV